MSIKLSGYEFDGPTLLTGWVAPRRAGVYAISYRADPTNKPNTYTIVYAGESENLADRGFPWNHHRSQCWINKAGSKSNVYISVYYMPNSTQAQRSSVEQKLIHDYNPACNE